ncbi:MAG: VOC family protein [Acidimicrobiia bacterium]
MSQPLGPSAVNFQVDAVFVLATDLDRSVEWYRTFGIEPGPRYDDWQTMKVGGEVHFALHGWDDHPGTYNAMVAFRVDDLDAELAHLAVSGIEPVDEITDIGVARFVTFADPDGNHVQLLERR